MGRPKLYHEKYFPNAFFKDHPSVEYQPDVYIDYSGNVEIEKNVTLAQQVIIETHDHNMDQANWRECKIISSSPLIIKEGAFIGARSIILSKCEYIGKYSVIGAGSVVTKSVPDYEIWAGNPAKKIRNVMKGENKNALSNK